ncbi:MAG: RDD family protein [Lentisphaeria bacterium]
MANERTYLVRTESGEEFGPVDQETLIRLTENGKITPYAQVRSVLVPRWEKAVNLPFLKQLLLEKQAKLVLDKKLSLWARIINRASFRAEDSVAMNSLVKVRADTFDRAPMFSRIFAGVIDLFLVTLGCLFLTGCCYLLLKQEILTPDNAAYILLLLCWLWMNFYYIFMISVKTQTLGQKFWGIFLVRNNALKFFAGRAFFYTIFMLFFGFFTPLHILLSPSKRSWQEILTGTKMVKTKLADNSRIR